MKFKNSEIFATMNFLVKIDMNAKASRARTKLTKRLGTWGDEYIESQKQIVIENGGVVDDDGNVDFMGDQLKTQSASIDRLELAQETVTIQEDFDGQFKALKSFFEEWNGEVSSIDAPAYDTLLDKLEQAEEK